MAYAFNNDRSKNDLSDVVRTSQITDVVRNARFKVYSTTITSGISMRAYGVYFTNDITSLIPTSEVDMWYPISWKQYIDYNSSGGGGYVGNCKKWIINEFSVGKTTVSSTSVVYSIDKICSVDRLYVDSGKTYLNFCVSNNSDIPISANRWLIFRCLFFKVV